MALAVDFKEGFYLQRINSTLAWPAMSMIFALLSTRRIPLPSNTNLRYLAIVINTTLIYAQGFSLHIRKADTAQCLSRISRHVINKQMPEALRPVRRLSKVLSGVRKSHELKVIQVLFFQYSLAHIAKKER